MYLLNSLQKSAKLATYKWRGQRGHRQWQAERQFGNEERGVTTQCRYLAVAIEYFGHGDRNF